MIEQKVNRRLGNRKTTTGCITCKIRRVKCDEARPSCRRCSNTGRRCDGYKQTIPDPNANRPLMALDLNDDEYQALQFFIDRAAPAIAGWTNLHFWVRIIPQLSQSHRAVRHAAIAIGSLMLSAQDWLFDTDKAVSGQSNHVASQAFALQQYGKAIQATLVEIKEERGDPQQATVTCLLLVCIEALQGHDLEAISLFRQGRSALGYESNTAVSIDASWDKIHASIDADVRLVFSNLAQQFMMFGTTSGDRAAMSDTVFMSPLPTPFLSMACLTEARHGLLSLLTFAQSVVWIGNNIKWSSEDPDTKTRLAVLSEKRDCIEKMLQDWYYRFLEIKENCRNNIHSTPQMRIGVSTLLQQYHILRIWLLTSLEVSECFYDNFISQFRTIISEATLVAVLAATTTNIASFSLDMGYVPPLYWTAIKCREPRLRRQALSLLTSRRRQEGLWNSRVAGKAAQRVIELEESAAVDSADRSDIFSYSGPQTLGLPPEEKRIKAVNIHLKGIVDEQEGYTVEFLSLPGGFSGAWDVRKEFFVF